MIPDIGKVLFYSKPMDMRKSIKGLSLFVAAHLLKEPTSGKLFVFYNKRRNKIKVLYWQTNGYCLFYKSLECALFILPKENEEKLEITRIQLRGLLEGLDINTIKGHQEKKYSVHY